MNAMMTSVAIPTWVVEDFSTVCPLAGIERDSISMCFVSVFSTREFLSSLLVSVASSSVRASFSELAGYGWFTNGVDSTPSPIGVTMIFPYGL